MSIRQMFFGVILVAVTLGLLALARQRKHVLATVSSYSTGAHALYESMGFTEFDLLEPWIKEFGD